MSIDTGEVIAILGILATIGGLFWKMRYDRVDLLARMEKAHNETWKELQIVRAENVTLKEQMQDLHEKWESSERYIKRLIVAMTDSGVDIPPRDDDEPEQPPKRKARK